jgi:acyl-CoA reductase-like NAD-dependent aldehyde dehydrogenase
MQQAANNLTPVHLELGGKAPVIVFADADLEQAAQWSMMAAFVNMGEVCVAGSRLLVERPVYNEVLEAVSEMSTHLPIGDALDPETFIGPLITEQHADRVRTFVETALADKTATLIGAGSLPEDLPKTFVAPTIMGGVDPGSALAQEEVFGPVLSALVFDQEDQALEIANGTRYGLNGTIFTGDLERAFRVAQHLHVGEVNINHHFTPNMNGGRGEPRKSSGFSRTGIEAYTSPKAVSLQTSQSVAR